MTKHCLSSHSFSRQHPEVHLHPHSTFQNNKPLTFKAKKSSGISKDYLNYLEKLKHEAFEDLTRQTTEYNQEVVERMRALENLPPKEQRQWMEANQLEENDNDGIMEKLTKTLSCSCGVKDFSELTEFYYHCMSAEEDEEHHKPFFFSCPPDGESWIGETF